MRESSVMVSGDSAMSISGLVRCRRSVGAAVVVQVAEGVAVPFYDVVAAFAFLAT
jgi:hypothetical protein